MFLERISCTASQVEVSTFDSLRIKVTNRCPWRCRFCHKEGSPSSQDLRLDEALLSAFHRFYNLGFKEIHLTGGEPSWYPECVRLVSELHNMGFQIKMTSNGQFDVELLKKLSDAGLHSINFSIHTLNPRNLAEIQAPQRSIEWGKKAMETQLQNLRAAREMGLRVKINTVVQDSIEDAIDVISFCRQEAIDLRLLNDLSLGSLSIEKIIEILQSLGAEIERIDLVDGVSSYSCRVATSTGFHFSVKAIRRCSLKTMCGYCSIRDQCQEWFYGIRVEQIHGEPMIRLCLHRQDFPAVQALEQFFGSEQFDEIKQLVQWETSSNSKIALPGL